ncbi:hypothetical protein [Enterobacillus tribolii]|uniref:Uncharacterized protein n=1 Tax=Enterobacillus tribolii TaxID=1487935 RepID=A0A370Q727_9GAMM|nr:hypothetical protein [Enterobacillus tribolii]MBW7984897.1 hypothetical protein [Enterobacillus tribolii]RDK84109.1 hypothetical protein C8D90_11428 [Enterobacillus tribolii]
MFNHAEKWVLRILAFIVMFLSVIASRVWVNPIDNAVRSLLAAGYLPTADYEQAFMAIALIVVCLSGLALTAVAEVVVRDLFQCVMEFFV